MSGDPSSGETRPRERVRWFDITRGIGIILVVYGHAIRGQIASHAYPPTPAIALQDMAIYAFHMPLFFFLSGLFAGHRGGEPANAARRLLWNIAYPYLLWSIIQISLNIAASQWVNTPFDFNDLGGIAWQPVGQFWFLYALLLCHLLLFLPRPIFYAVGLAACFFGLGDVPKILNWAMQELPFFAFGVWLTAARAAVLLAPRSRAAALGLAAAALFAIALSLYRENIVTHDWYAFRIVIAGAGILLTLAIGRMFVSGSGWLEHLGRASMPIFLMHVIAAAALRTVLAKVHNLPPTLVLMLVTAFGLFAPYAVARLAMKWRISGWLGFGGGPRGRLGAA